MENLDNVLEEEQEIDVQVTGETAVKWGFLLVAFEPQDEFLVEGEQIRVDDDDI